MFCRPGLRLRARDGDENVAEIARPGFRVGLRCRKGQYIGRRVGAEIITVELMQLRVVGQDKREIALCVLMWQRGPHRSLDQFGCDGSDALGCHYMNHDFVSLASGAVCTLESAGGCAAGY